MIPLPKPGTGAGHLGGPRDAGGRRWPRPNGKDTLFCLMQGRPDLRRQSSAPRMQLQGKWFPIRCYIGLHWPPQMQLITAGLTAWHLSRASCTHVPFAGRVERRMKQHVCGECSEKRDVCCSRDSAQVFLDASSHSSWLGRLPYVLLAFRNPHVGSRSWSGTIQSAYPLPTRHRT